MDSTRAGTLASLGQTHHSAIKAFLLTIIPHQDAKQKRTVKIPLENFPKRPNKTTRVRIAAGFLDEKTMALKIVDRGFGELFPKTDAEIRQEVRI